MKFLFQEKNSHDLADKLESIFKMSEAEKQNYTQEMRSVVREKHELTKLAKKIAVISESNE